MTATRTVAIELLTDATLIGSASDLPAVEAALAEAKVLLGKPVTVAVPAVLLAAWNGSAECRSRLAKWQAEGVTVAAEAAPDAGSPVPGKTAAFGAGSLIGCGAPDGDDRVPWPEGTILNIGSDVSVCGVRSFVFRDGEWIPLLTGACQ